MKTQAYPLLWPDSWPRTESRSGAQFKTSLAKAIKNVKQAIASFAKDSKKEVTDLVISSNVTLGAQSPKDPGVVAYFIWDGIETSIPVDRYLKVEHNLQAIYHCIEAERTKLRHGGLHLVRAAFRGYALLSAPKNSQNWWDVLQCRRDASVDTIKKQYKRLCQDYHTDRPDGTGDTEKFQAVQHAYKGSKS